MISIDVHCSVHALYREDNYQVIVMITPNGMTYLLLNLRSPRDYVVRSSRRSFVRACGMC